MKYFFQGVNCVSESGISSFLGGLFRKGYSQNCSLLHCVSFRQLVVVLVMILQSAEQHGSAELQWTMHFRESFPKKIVRRSHIGFYG